MSSSKVMCLLVTIGRLKEHFYVAVSSSVAKTELYIFFKGIFEWSENNEIRRGTARAMEGKDARKGKGKGKWKRKGKGKRKVEAGLEASAKVEPQKCSFSLPNI